MSEKQTPKNFVKRHYKLDSQFALEEWLEFLTEVCQIAEEVYYFRAFPHIYLSVESLSDECDLYGNPLEEGTTVEDVFFKWRQFINQKKELKTKPSPEKTFYGEWINAFELLEKAKSAGNADPD